MNKITVGNVCFILNKDESSVLLLHRNREPMKGLWTGVGGKTHFSEDIHSSCLREVQEETQLSIENTTLKGVIKTILKDKDSSWILFIYTSIAQDTTLYPCDEGELAWVKKEEAKTLPFPGFIHEVFPHILKENHFVEGTFLHDSQGKILESTLKVSTPNSLIPH